MQVVVMMLVVVVVAMGRVEGGIALVVVVKDREEMECGYKRMRDGRDEKCKDVCCRVACECEKGLR